MRLLFLLVAVFAASAVAEQWYHTDFVNCYEVLGLEQTADVATVQRAVRRVTSRTHPDRCKTEECALKFRQANNCKETLTDVLLRNKYNEFLEQGILPTPSRGPPRTSFIIIVLITLVLTNYLHFRMLQKERKTAFNNTWESMVRRKVASDAEKQALLEDLNIQSPYSLLSEVWLARLLVVALPSLQAFWTSTVSSSASSGQGANTSTAFVSRKSAARDPSSAAVWALVHQGLRFSLVMLAAWFAWTALTSISGSHSPLYVVRPYNRMAGYSAGDLLILKWGRGAIEELKAGSVIAYYVLEEDDFVTLSRLTAVHKEGNSRGERVVGGDVWLMSRADNSTADERKLRLGSSSEQYLYGRDEFTPGVVWYKIPLLGYPILLLGDGSVFVYLVVLAFALNALVQAGSAAKKARLGRKTTPPVKLRKSE